MALHIPLYTVDELQDFPDDGNRYELLDEVLLVTPAPAAIHSWSQVVFMSRLPMRFRSRVMPMSLDQAPL